jgi:hypothetical protein
MICLLHYGPKPCEQCAHSAFLQRVFYDARIAQDAHLAAPAVITFKPLVFEHMFHPWEKPRAFDTPRELLRESTARGHTPNYLRESTLWRSREPRWL